MTVEWIFLWVGVGMFGVGTTLAWIASQTLRRPPLPSRQSYLAPVLAIDVLDTDLRVAYARTLVLDARSDEDPLIREIGLGAELRRLILEIQASRQAGEPIEVMLSELLEVEDDWAARKAEVRLLRERLRLAPELSEPLQPPQK